MSNDMRGFAPSSGDPFGGGDFFDSFENSSIFEYEKPHTQPSRQQQQKPTREQPSGRSKKPGKKVPRKKMGTKGSALVWRYLIVTGMVGLMAFGIYRTIEPAPTLTENEVAYMAAKGLNLGSFPADKVQPLIVSYMNDYLTYSQKRQSSLANYGTVDVSYRPAEGSAIVSGPFIGDVNYIDGNSASVNVLVNVTGAGWMNFSVPVIYSAKSDAFIIPAEPTLIPAPSLLSEKPQLETENLGSAQSPDIVERMKPVINTFFSAYAESDVDAIKTSTLDGVTEPSAYSGMKGKYSLSKVDDVKAWKRAGTPEGNYWATVKVSWEITYSVASVSSDGKESVETRESSIASEYQMKMVDKGGKFYVVSIEPIQRIIKKGTTGVTGADSVKKTENNQDQQTTLNANNPTQEDSKQSN